MPLSPRGGRRAIPQRGAAVADFFDFCSADRTLLCALSTYCDEVIPYFAEATLDGEQELRWTAIHGEFMARCEEGLLRWVESRENVNMEMVCEEIAALFDAPTAASRDLPLSFRLADYRSFVEEIVNRRERPQRILDADGARRRARTEPDASLSGLWRALPDVSTTDVERYLTVLGTPAWLRGSATRRVRSLVRAVLRHEEGKFEVSFDWGWFGHTHEVLTLDGTGDVRAWADLSPGATTISVRRVDESSGAALEEEWRVEKKSLVWKRRARLEDDTTAELLTTFGLEKLTRPGKQSGANGADQD